MSPLRFIVASTLLTAALAVRLVPSARVSAQSAAPIDAAIFHEMRWRPLGPDHAGRTTALAASPVEPTVFYEGVEGAGLWATDDSGLSWRPLFDAPPQGSIGALAVSSSSPTVIYAGTGEVTGNPIISRGSGLYQSTDGGVTWAHTALDTTAPIAAVIVSPRDADRVWVVVAEGTDQAFRWIVARSLDGGRTFTRVLERTGARTMQMVVGHDLSLYAVIGIDGPALPRSLVLRSRDDGATWQPLQAPGDDMTIAAGPRTDRLYATTRSGTSGVTVYRSENDGDSWQLAGRPAPAPAGDRVSLSIDPADPDRLWLAAGTLWSSIDAGRTWQATLASPDIAEAAFAAHGAGGRTLAVAGRGASVTSNGGRTWSATTAPATTAVSAIATDAAFPFRICGIERAGSAVCVSSRADPDPALTGGAMMPFASPGAVLPDPTNADEIYAGSFERVDRRTGQIDDVWPSPSAPSRPAVMAFSPDGRTLYAADTAAWKFSLSAQTWTRLSLDTGEAASGASVTALAVSSIDPRTLWAGTGTGSIYVSRDGGATWSSSRVDASGVVMIEPSHFDPRSAYAVRTAADGRASLTRTRDGGSSWVPIASGLASGERVLAVREDVFRRGLLVAGTDRSLLLSFDDGNTWQPWRLNLPATPIQDLAIRDTALIAATGGRGFWILDDLSPLRQLTADIGRAPVFLFRPAPAWRMRAEPAGPDGRLAAADAPATLWYLLDANVRGPVSLEVIETATGDVIRRFDLVPAGQTSAGLHQVPWDLRYTAPTDAGGDLGPLVVPGTYQIRLTANGRPWRQALVVRADPRMRATTADLAAQLALARAVDGQIAALTRRLNAFSGGHDAAAMSALATLRDLARLVERTDARPSTNLATAAAQAIARAASLPASR